ncbi:MAG: hypothetical protein NVSMB1_02410 [Polyangiales bacterium]
MCPSPMDSATNRRKSNLVSGFMNRGYLLVFQIADASARKKLDELCEGEWQGDQITDDAWEITNELDPDAMEKTIADLVGEHDRVAYYYLTDAKRMFRVVLS